MALSVWFNGCCPSQRLTGVAKRCCLFDCMFHGQIHTLDFGTYRVSLFLYTIKYVYQICIKNKKISNDQELIQSDPTSCPQNQKGNN